MSGNVKYLHYEKARSNPPRAAGFVHIRRIPKEHQHLFIGKNNKPLAKFIRFIGAVSQKEAEGANARCIVEFDDIINAAAPKHYRYVPAKARTIEKGGFGGGWEQVGTAVAPALEAAPPSFAVHGYPVDVLRDVVAYVARAARAQMNGHDAPRPNPKRRDPGQGRHLRHDD